MLFTFPSRYWFTIGRRVVFSLGGWAPQIPTGFHVSRRTWEKNRREIDFAYGAITRYGPASQLVLLSHSLVTPWACAHYPAFSRNPRPGNACRLHTGGFGLSPRSLAATWGISVDLFSCRYLDVSVPYVRALHQLFRLVGCPIRRSPGQMLTYS